MRAYLWTESGRMGFAPRRNLCADRPCGNVESARWPTHGRRPQKMQAGKNTHRYAQIKISRWSTEARLGYPMGLTVMSGRYQGKK